MRAREHRLVNIWKYINPEYRIKGRGSPWMAFAPVVQREEVAFYNAFAQYLLRQELNGHV